MKKVTLVLLMIFIVASMFAQFGYTLDVLSFDPLYREYYADKYRAGMTFNYAYVADGFPNYVYQDWRQKNQVGDHQDTPQIFWLTEELSGAPYIGIVNVGETLSLLRHTFIFNGKLSPISIDFSAQGLISFIMEGEMADNIGFDGVYFYGAHLRVANTFSLRAGLHHYCSHYGDAILKRIDNTASSGDLSELDKFWITYKYVRMNGIAIGLSIEPFSWMRVYGEYNFLSKNVDSWRPVIFRPSWTNLEPHYNFPDDYKARIINFGLELQFPIFTRLGNTIAAYDCHMYEEGKILYKDEHGIPNPNMTPLYLPDSPYEVEHSFLIAQEVNESVSFEIGYRYGRFPANSFYYERSSYFFFGARFNPKATVKLIDVRN